MATLDIGKAVFSGFRLIGREPLAFAGWAVFLLVLVGGPFLGMFAYMLSVMPQLIAASEAGREPSPELVMGMMGGLYALYPLLLVGSIVGRVMIAGAVMRAVLEPEARRWAYFRLGIGELMMAVTAFIISMVIGVLAMVGVGLAFGFGLVAWQFSEAAGVAIGAAIALGVAGVAVWLSLRLSLVPVMSFAQREFRLAEGWRLTQGRAGSLFGLAVLLVLVVIVVEVVIGLLVAAVVVALAAGGMFEPAASGELLNIGTPAKAGLLLLVSGAVAVVAALFQAVFLAPWAEAYRQLGQDVAVADPRP